MLNKKQIKQFKIKLKIQKIKTLLSFNKIEQQLLKNFYKKLMKI